MTNDEITIIEGDETIDIVESTGVNINSINKDEKLYFDAPDNSSYLIYVSAIKKYHIFIENVKIMEIDSSGNLGILGRLYQI